MHPCVQGWPAAPPPLDGCVHVQQQHRPLALAAQLAALAHHCAKFTSYPQDPELTQRIGRMFGEHLEIPNKAVSAQPESGCKLYFQKTIRQAAMQDWMMMIIIMDMDLILEQRRLEHEPAGTCTHGRMHDLTDGVSNANKSFSTAALQFDFVRQAPKRNNARPLSGDLPPLPADVAVPVYVSKPGAFKTCAGLRLCA